MFHVNNQAEETIFLNQKVVIFMDSKWLYSENYLLLHKHMKLLLFDKFMQYLFNLKLDSTILFINMHTPTIIIIMVVIIMELSPNYMQYELG